MPSFTDKIRNVFWWQSDKYYFDEDNKKQKKRKVWWKVIFDKIGKISEQFI